MCGFACNSWNSQRVAVCGNGSNVCHLSYVHQEEECLEAFEDFLKKEDAEIVWREIECKKEDEANCRFDSMG